METRMTKVTKQVVLGHEVIYICYYANIYL